MIIELNIDKSELLSINIEIDGTSIKLDEDMIKDDALKNAKLDFLREFNDELDLAQANYMLEKVPSSIYFGEMNCSRCGALKEIDDAGDWQFDEANEEWICPTCLEKDVEENEEMVEEEGEEDS